MMYRANRRKFMAGGLACGVSISTPSILRAKTLPIVRLQGQSGSLDTVPALIIQNEALDKKFGFEGTFEMLTAEGANQNFLLGKTDVTVDNDIMGVAIARNEGFEIAAFYPICNLHPGIVVSGASTYQSPNDLKGKKVGHFGEFSGTTMFLRYIVQKLYGFDLLKEYDIVQVSPGALVEMLKSGEIEAMMNFETFATQAIVATKGRFLLQGYPAFMQATNNVFAPWITNLVARDEWLKANPVLAYAVRDAYDEALRMMTESKYEILRKDYIVAALPVLKEEGVLETLIPNAYAMPYFTNKWDRPAIDAGNVFLKEMAATGQSINTAPEGVMVMLEEFVGPRP